MNGVLYGTTSKGGLSGCRCGTVFSASPSTGRERVVYRFGGMPDGDTPTGDLIVVNGVLYGATVWGGNPGCWPPSGCGTVFAVNLVSGQETVVYRFQGGGDGEHPFAGLLSVNGTLYGTTAEGGIPSGSGCDYGDGCGTLFSLEPSSGTETVLYRFPGGQNAERPYSSLIDANGALYGTAGGGIAGTVYTFSLAPGLENVIYTFRGGDKDGTGPLAVLYLNGVLYGTTQGGGFGCHNYFKGCGTVFSIDLSSRHETVLYSFNGGKDGARPYAGLITLNGTLYGTTDGGGGSCGNKNGCGTVFAVTK